MTLISVVCITASICIVIAAYGLGTKRLWILKGAGILLLGVLAMGTMYKGYSLFSRARSLAKHPIFGQWTCVDPTQHCAPSLTFDDTTWQMGDIIYIDRDPAIFHDGWIISGSDTCEFSFFESNQIDVNCGGNTISFQYTISGDLLTLNVSSETIELQRAIP